MGVFRIDASTLLVFLLCDVNAIFLPTLLNLCKVSRSLEKAIASYCVRCKNFRDVESVLKFGGGGRSKEGHMAILQKWHICA